MGFESADMPVADLAEKNTDPIPNISKYVNPRSKSRQPASEGRGGQRKWEARGRGAPALIHRRRTDINEMNEHET